MNPFRKTTKTRLAPQRKADVAQSNAVSPAPKTMTVPCSDGNEDLHRHIPDDKKPNYKTEDGKYLIKLSWPGLLAADTFGKKSFDV